MQDETIRRWAKALHMWGQGKNTTEIAIEYKVSTAAMRTRIQKFRRKYGWFPPRDPATDKTLA